MRPIVSKFGGSSTATAEAFRRIRSILDQSPARRCVVLSAPGTDRAHPEKVTALLERCWQLRDRPGDLKPLLRAVVERYASIAGALGLYNVAPLCEDEILRGLYISRAHTLSRGEYLCARLFSEYSGLEMVDASRVIRFDREGRLSLAETLSAIDREARGRRRPIVLPGFYGADAAGNITVFPRNGSDITGALAAAGMNAKLYENWTDVPGLMTADPAIVPDARLIRQVSYRQMRRMARAGAQVLHPACLDPVAMAGIPTRLRCPGRPECFGTLIDDHCDAVSPCLVGNPVAQLPGTPESGEVACLSLFGVRQDRALEAAEGLPLLAAESDRDCARLYVAHQDYERSLRQLHRRLLE